MSNRLLTKGTPNYNGDFEGPGSCLDYLKSHGMEGLFDNFRDYLAYQQALYGGEFDYQAIPPAVPMWKQMHDFDLALIELGFDSNAKLPKDFDSALVSLNCNYQ